MAAAPHLEAGLVARRLLALPSGVCEMVWGRISPRAMLVWLLLASQAALAGDPLVDAVTALEGAVPVEAEGFREPPALPIEQLTAAVDRQAAERAWSRTSNPANQLRHLLSAHQRVTLLEDRCLKLRGQFSQPQFGPLDREAGTTDEVEQARATLRRYLSTNHRLLGLAGRLRYTLVDVLQQAWTRYRSDPQTRAALLDALIDYRSEVGALVMAKTVLDPAALRSDPAAARFAGDALRLVAETGQLDALDEVAAYLGQSGLETGQVLAAARTIRRLGLPQDPRPGQAEELPAPAITAAVLRARLEPLASRRLTAEQTRELDDHLAWLQRRAQQGLEDESFRLGRFELQPGDWLLMRNPSPFNLFTDLSPGLFTHVGVVALETAGDGKRRLVVVDLPEHGTHMPATNVEIFLQRTLHYVFLRHRDPEVRGAMAEAARSVIGNEIEFDLNFRTERIEELAGKPLAGVKIKTYCAGLLLLCAQAADRPRTEFFPVPEYPAGGYALENVAQLGMSVGRDFVSPSGALFSPELELVGRSEPMYDPTREIEEAVYDHFARQIVEQRLRPSPTWTQSLTQRLAEASRWNRLLARTLAGAAGVSADTDLVAAAKTSAVIETLDEIAQGASREFVAAREALRGGSESELRRQGLSRDQLAQVRRLRSRYADLYRRFTTGQLSPRELRRQLVAAAISAGRQQLDDRFFEAAGSTVLGQDR